MVSKESAIEEVGVAEMGMLRWMSGVTKLTCMNKTAVKHNYGAISGMELLSIITYLCQHKRRRPVRDQVSGMISNNNNIFRKTFF